MNELIWRLDEGPLDERDRVAPIVEHVAAIPGFEPVDYDLNQKKQWREFDRRRTVVDALTQRTQLVRIRGEQPGAVAMVAMGKHGEQPTVVVRLPDPITFRSLVDDWPALIDDLDLALAMVTSETWRDALASAGVLWEDGAFSPAMVYGWPEEREPVWLGELGRGSEQVVESTSISLEPMDGGTVLWLAPSGEIEGEDHRRALGTIGELAT